MNDVMKEKMNELMNRISLALKDTVLQQGFEVICKKLADLEKEYKEKCNNMFAQNTILLHRIDELEGQIEKMKNCKNCKNWNWKHNKCEKKLKGDCFKNSKWELPE